MSSTIEARRASADAYSLAPWKPVAVDDLMRIGREEDGGYVVSRRSVDATRVLVGCGICDDWSFEQAFISVNPNVVVVGIDGSVSPAVFRSRARERVMHAIFSALKMRGKRTLAELRAARGLMDTADAFKKFFDGKARRFHQVFLADEAAEWSATWPAIWKAESALAAVRTGTHEVFVKMDIEGAEYRVLTDLLPEASKISGLVVEFHECDVHWGRFTEIMNALSEKFAVVHVHGNNYAPLIRGSKTPRALEISFLNRDLVRGETRPSERHYPAAGLDRPCNPAKPDYAISF